METKSTKKNVYFCKFCNFTTYRKSHMSRHLQTDKHKQNEELKFTPSNENDFNINAINHNKQFSQFNIDSNTYDIQPDFDVSLSNTKTDYSSHELYNCLCGKKYKTRGGLWKHKKSKTCKYFPEDDTSILEEVEFQTVKPESNLEDEIQNYRMPYDNTCSNINSKQESREKHHNAKSQQPPILEKDELNNSHNDFKRYFKRRYKKCK